MSALRQIEPAKWEGNVFERIGTHWMLICTKKGEKVNLMTASWGGVGVLWHLPVAHAYVRPQRFTRELIDAADTYSLLFFGPEYREQFNLCGSKSGREIDKVAACGFTARTDPETGTAYVQEATDVLICRKLYTHDLAQRGFVDQGIPPKMYPDGDFHRAYVGEIVKLLVK